MFKHLLVPLDGSRLSESALPAAAQMAARMGAELTLVHVIEKNAPAEVHSDRHLVTAEEATAYLAEVARRPVLAGLRVQTHVHTAEVSDVADSITEHAAELAPDLVVMSTHGRGGARRLIFGAIAQQVISRGATPVLLVRPSEEAASGASGPADTWRTILAPAGRRSCAREEPAGRVCPGCRLCLPRAPPHGGADPGRAGRFPGRRGNASSPVPRSSSWRWTARRQATTWRQRRKSSRGREWKRGARHHAVTLRRQSCGQRGGWTWTWWSWERTGERAPWRSGREAWPRGSSHARACRCCWSR